MLANLIVTNNTEYLEQTIDSVSKLGDTFVVFDGIKPIEGDFTSLSCNANSSSVARKTGVEAILKNKDYKFIQFIDSDDYLVNDPRPYLFRGYDLFYSDFVVKNEDFDYQYTEYLPSASIGNMRFLPYKIKNPIVRTSRLCGKNAVKIDQNLRIFSIADLIYQIGPTGMCHIPYTLYTCRIHAKMNSRLVPEKERMNCLSIIKGRLNGKISV